jgi:hypothetical protein
VYRKSIVALIGPCLGTSIFSCDAPQDHVSSFGVELTDVSGLRIQYHTSSGPTAGEISPLINVVNSGTAAVTLSDLTARYWYTKTEPNPRITGVTTPRVAAPT